MSDTLTMALPIIVLAIGWVSYYLGIRVRDAAHCMIPFFDPVSLILICLTVSPFIIDSYIELPIDPFGYEYISCVVGFYVGYAIGYCSTGADVVYVSVHEIVAKRQDIYPIVRYYNREGRLCWQPQTFRGICRAMFLHVDNPLDLSAVQRTRSVTLKQAFHMVNKADAIDVAGMEVNEYTQKRGPFTFRIEARRYLAVPYCTDAPYDWILNANKYEDLFMEYAKLQVSAVEAESELNVAMVKGGGIVRSALASKNPDKLFMEELGLDLEDMVSQRAKDRRKAKRQLRREQE